ncbi:MAG TPA: AMP-binding protein [Acidimicrobiales bacterium]
MCGARDSSPCDSGPLFADDLLAHADRVAVVTAGGTLSYAQLDARVREVAGALGRERRLVMIEAANAVEPLVAYLAALRGGHPALLVPGDNPAVAQGLSTAYDPDVVIGRRGGWSVEERRAGSQHHLHPELALLLSTSGSTGSAKLVRLSRRNLAANAASIAEYLGIDERDRAVTSLPMQYCYGLSVINSHLATGAGLVLTDLSVVDSCFWDLVGSTGVTDIAGVPHTFDLLDRVGFAGMSLPDLRFVTQAGGRLDPDTVRRYAALGERDGWRFYVMYGQTEATARMAYLPAELASSRPQAIGVPIPGGSFAIHDPGANGVGELVYRGANVMLGYAERPGDLALGRTVTTLHTGDLARRAADGLYEVVGRRSRFVKLYGLRIDLDQVERLLAGRGTTALCTGGDGGLVLAVARGTDVAGVRQLVGTTLRLPLAAVRVAELDELPRLGNGKPDYVTVRELAAGCSVGGPRPPDAPAGADGATRAAVGAAFAVVLGREPSDDDTFVGLGGDSLSYVEISIRLEHVLGVLPRDWHVTPVAGLAAIRRRHGRLRRLETTVVVRAVAIVLVVGTHARLWYLPGGAHALLGLAGYNFARFQSRGSSAVPSIARIAVPSMVWIAIAAATTGEFGWQHALLLNGHTGGTGARWSYWYVEALVQILVLLSAVLAVPAVRRAERRWPFGAALVVVAAALAVRFDVVDLASAHHRTSRPHEVLWLFALGWAAARASTPGRRLVVSLLVVAAVPGFFGMAPREAIVAAGLLLVAWLPTVPAPRAAARALGVVASASLYIYLTHWQVYPPLLRDHGAGSAVVGSVVAGVAAWLVARWVVARVQAAVGRATRRPVSGAARPPGRPAPAVPA